MSGLGNILIIQETETVKVEREVSLKLLLKKAIYNMEDVQKIKNQDPIFQRRFR